MAYKRRGPLYVLTDGDLAILEQADEDARYFTDFYLSLPDGGEAGRWVMDPWQLVVHHATQPEHTIVGGFGCGKTIGVATSACTYAARLQNFKFMNCAQVSWQANQMFRGIEEQFTDTRWWERFVWKVVERPFAMIVLRFRVPKPGGGLYTHTATLEFMSTVDQATNILSWWGDWVNIDEAGLLSDLDQTITHLGTRTRGRARGGRPRMGRLSLTSNSWDHLAMWARFEQPMELSEVHDFNEGFPGGVPIMDGETQRGELWADPEYLSIRLETYDNKHLTEQDFANFERRMPDDERERWMRGFKPKAKGNDFAERVVRANAAEWLDNVMTACLDDPDRQFDVRYETTRQAGVVAWALPPARDRLHVIIGDPGQGNAPQRNAPVVIVWDVTGFPEERCTLRAFWWGMGMGTYDPFIQQFLTWHSSYACLDGVFDSTGTQTGFETIFNLLESVPVSGFSLAGTRKYQYNIALGLLLEHKMFAWPAQIKGIRNQLINYRVTDDKKLRQDIVSAFQLTAGWLRHWYSTMSLWRVSEPNEDYDLPPVIEHPRFPRRSDLRHSPRDRASRLYPLR